MKEIMEAPPSVNLKEAIRLTREVGSLFLKYDSLPQGPQKEETFESYKKGLGAMFHHITQHPEAYDDPSALRAAQEFRKKVDILKTVPAFLREHKILDNCKDLIVLFSGGKDCTALLYALTEKGVLPNHVNLRVPMVVYPAHMYTKELIDEMKKFWGKRGVKITDMRPDRKDPPDCGGCKIGRKELVDPFVEKHLSQSTVVLTGYTLHDLTAYACLAHKATKGTFSPKQLGPNKDDVLRHLPKFRPFQTLGNLRIARPLGEAIDPEIRSFVSQMPIVKLPCNNSRGKLKRDLVGALSCLGCVTDLKILTKVVTSNELRLPHNIPTSVIKDLATPRNRGPLNFVDC